MESVLDRLLFVYDLIEIEMNIEIKLLVSDLLCIEYVLPLWNLLINKNFGDINRNVEKLILEIRVVFCYAYNQTCFG